jgi:hypothetical protein
MTSIRLPLPLSDFSTSNQLSEGLGEIACHLHNLCVTALASTSGQTKGTYCMHMKFRCL